MYGVATGSSEYLKLGMCVLSSRTTMLIDPTPSLTSKRELSGSMTVNIYGLHPEVSSFIHNIRRPVINMISSSSIIYFMIALSFFVLLSK